MDYPKGMHVCKGLDDLKYYALNSLETFNNVEIFKKLAQSQSFEMFCYQMILAHRFISFIDFNNVWMLANLKQCNFVDYLFLFK